MNVRWPDVVRFVRQLSHDFRNHLNAVELQAAFLGELATDAEMKEEIKRLRQMVAECSKSLQKLTAKLTAVKPNLMSYRAGDFMEDFRTKLAAEFAKESATIEWNLPREDGKIDIDVQLLQEALLELFKNAFENQGSQGQLRASGRLDGDNFVFTLQELKPSFDMPTDNWGHEPLRHVNRGHYGLGLNRARSIVEAHGGRLTARYDPTLSELVTTITFPSSAAQS